MGSQANRSFSTLGTMGQFSFGGTAIRFKHQKLDAAKNDLGGAANDPKTQEQISRGVIKQAEEDPAFGDCPGPGAYALPSSFLEPEDIERNTSSFQQPLKRQLSTLKREEEVRPGPMSYNPKILSDISRITHLPPAKEGFLGSGERFSGGSVQKLAEGERRPGPTAYTKPSPFEVGSLRGHSMNRAQSMSFATTSERFQEPVDRGNNRRPGPGQYAVSKLLGTRSYNILFAGNCNNTVR